jgi:3-mercaptopyruvate sulfurtransferase SseA
MDKGFKRVRPLEGGIEAWIAAGYEAPSQYNNVVTKGEENGQAM